MASMQAACLLDIVKGGRTDPHNNIDTDMGPLHNNGRHNVCPSATGSFRVSHMMTK